MRITAATSLAVLLGATMAFGQDEVARRQAVEVAARVPFEKAITGAPYSAETLVEGIQTLADGNRIVRKTTGRVYRDGEGRTRREEIAQPMSVRTPTGDAVSTSRMAISIVDPVGGFSYSLDPERKIAWRTPIGTSANILGKVEAASAQARKIEEMKRAEEMTAERRAAGKESPDDQQKLDELKRKIAAEGGGGRGVPEPGSREVRMRGNAEGYAFNPGPLERKTLDGVLVEGRKTTTVIPAGQVGNEQPLTIVSEEWRSPDLNVLVLTRHSDPRTGESTYRLTNIIRAEPDRSLFMVPADYEVRESGVRKMLEQAQRKD